MCEDIQLQKRRKLDRVMENITNGNCYNQNDEKPLPSNIAEFLEDPYRYHPNAEFMNSNFVEVLFVFQH